VRGVKFCTGSASCKKGYLNTMEMGLKIDERFHRRKLLKKSKYHYQVVQVRVQNHMLGI